jgi:hypothetical protein
MAAPDWTKYVRVDVIIECRPISKETERELLQAMPNAYGGEAPGENDWPEPDAKRDEPYKLARIWDKLSASAQADIAKASGIEPEPKPKRPKADRKAREDAYRDLGMTKVRGNLGGTYYE